MKQTKTDCWLAIKEGVMSQGDRYQDCSVSGATVLFRSNISLRVIRHSKNTWIWKVVGQRLTEGGCYRILKATHRKKQTWPKALVLGLEKGRLAQESLNSWFYASLLASPTSFPHLHPTFNRPGLLPLQFIYSVCIFATSIERVHISLGELLLRKFSPPQYPVAVHSRFSPPAAPARPPSFEHDPTNSFPQEFLPMNSLPPDNLPM